MKLLTYLNTSGNVRKIQHNRLFKKSVMYKQMLWIQMRNCWQLGIYFTHPTVWLTAAEISKETHVLLCCPLIKWALQVHVAKDNSILGDGIDLNRSA